MSYPTGMVPTYGTPQSPGVVQVPLPVSRNGAEFMSSSISRAPGVPAYFPGEINQLQFTPPPTPFAGRDRYELIKHRFFN